MGYMKQLKKVFFNKQFIIFIIIGGINTLSSIIFSSIYTLLLGEVQSFGLGYVTGVIVSYTLNTLFTFKDTFALSKLIKFAISTIPNFLIQFIIVYIGIRLLHIHHIICYGIAAILGIPVTFLILKLFVYTRNK